MTFARAVGALAGSHATRALPQRLPRNFARLPAAAVERTYFVRLADNLEEYAEETS